MSREMITQILAIIGVFGLGFCAGAAYAFHVCFEEIAKRIEDGRLVEMI